VISVTVKMSINCLAGGTPVRGIGSLSSGGQAEPDQTQYQFGQILSRPSSLTSVVQLARQRNSQKHVVIKKYLLDQTSVVPNEEELSRHIQHEVSTMKQLQHPNIQSCVTSFVADQEIWVVEPLMPYGSVRDLVKAHFHDGLPEMACCFILRDLVMGLLYLHNQGIVHRSVRASHVLISETGAAILTGFRYCTNLHSTGENRTNLYDYPLHGVAGNLNWLAPEILQQNLLGYNESSDLYSLSVTACEMANGLVPFSEMPPTLMLLEKLRGVAPKLMDASTMSHPNGPDDELPGFQGHPADSGVGDSVGSCTNMLNKDSVYHTRQFSGQFHQFVEDCSQLSPLDRPHPQHLLNHYFLKQLKKTPSTLVSLLDPIQPLVPSIGDCGEIGDAEALIVEQMESLDVNEAPVEEQQIWDF